MRQLTCFHSASGPDCGNVPRSQRNSRIKTQREASATSVKFSRDSKNSLSGGNRHTIVLISAVIGLRLAVLSVFDARINMKTWIAMLVTFGLLATCGWIATLTGVNLFMLLVVGTSVWAGVDSAGIYLKKYQSGISYGPVPLALLCSVFWIVAFPWYLSMRYKIRTGTARLRPEFEPWDMGSGQMSPRGLVQPWQGKRL